MIITPTEASVFLPQPEVKRGTGVHASNIVRNIAAEMGILKREYVDDIDHLVLTDTREITDRTAILRMAIGLAWEDWYIKNMLAPQGVQKHPGEMLLDGIHMSPDGESLELRPEKIKGPFGGKKYAAYPSKYTLVIHEVKATYKSINTVADFNNQWMWLTQIKCYCKGAKTRYGRFHVLFLCGDYKFPIRPIKMCWDIEFTQKELDDNWELMTCYRDQRS